MGLCGNNFGKVLPHIPRGTPQYLEHEALNDIDYLIRDGRELPDADKGTT